MLSRLGFWLAVAVLMIVWSTTEAVAQRCRMVNGVQVCDQGFFSRQLLRPRQQQVIEYMQPVASYYQSEQVVQYQQAQPQFTVGARRPMFRLFRR